jgi:long-chain acyl-CoA synthetase
VSRWGDEIVVETVRGFPCRVYRDRPRSLAALLDDTAPFADRRALVQGERVVTFAELRDLVDAAAAGFVERGVAPGDRVLLLGRNSIDWVVSLWAIWQVGAIAAVANAAWGPDQVSDAVALVEPVLTAPLLNAPVADQPLGVTRLTVGCPQLGDEDDAAVLVFTSGTTGAPKAATLSHRAVLANLQALLHHGGRLPGGEPKPPTVTLMSVPLFHIGGLQQVLTAALSGGCLVFDGDRFDPVETLAVMEGERVLVWAAVPTMVTRVLDALDDHDVSSVLAVTMGGAPVSAELRVRVRRAFPSLRRGAGVSYGLTEAGGVVAAGIGPALEERPGTVGKHTPLADVRIADGEILVRSAAVMTGYWGGTDSPVDADGWLATGDRGHLDEDGYLFVTGRAKDLVIRAGENISCPRVEAVLAAHPAVAEAAVIGLPDADLGERVAAVVVLREDCSEAALDTFARARLARFEVPSAWWLRDEPLPVNAAGKVVKAGLADGWPAVASKTSSCYTSNMTSPAKARHVPGSFPLITDEALDDLRARIGQTFDRPHPHVTEATKDSIRHWTLGIGDTNPLYGDAEYAAKSRWGGITAPGSFLYAFDKVLSGYVSGLPGIHAMFAGTDFRWERPVRLGDAITAVPVLKELVDLKSDFSGRAVKQVYEVTFRTADGDLVCVADSWCIRTQRDIARQRGQRDFVKPRMWTTEEIADIDARYLAYRRRGAEPRHWEDVTEGDELPELLKGPSTVTGFVAFTQGWGSLYVKAHGVAMDMFRSHPALGIPNAQGVPEPPERVHWDNDLAQAVGVPAAYDYGPERISWLGNLMTDWIGDDGFLNRLNVQVRRHNIIGDLTVCRGRVLRKFVEDGQHRVEVRIEGVNQNDEVTCGGTATATLPSRA